MHRKFLIAALVLAAGVGLYFFLADNSPEYVQPEPEPILKTHSVIGSSVEGREIEVFTFGTGTTDILLVGGIHGGYEWNSTLLAYEFIDHFDADISRVPSNIKIHIVPALNPDGLYMITKKEGRFTLEDIDESGPVGTGRFNANGVDLNRNFACKWQPESTWRGNVVSAGTEAFSEPEAAAIRDYVSKTNPKATVFWHSQADAVFASECENGILPETLALMNTYAEAAEYKAIESFGAYPVTGDVEGWLASINIPSITVELSTHETLEWEKNLAGTNAVLELYAQ
jgi:hypothetical protein